ncbi:DUF1002 domain-containing protein [Alkalicoccus halolimnae]|uniref:DUF1002 domain-containing protein n=1 Tax=Alkalicoccus halolimnae TaxID=1667239 RepID=A0AAJ8LW14_9BACI|nr:DUF1002 domain-containing protein [Alkalicoccus halolimnae]
MYQSIKVGLIAFTAWFAFASTAGADAMTGEEIITLGEDLNPQQQEELLSEMGASEEETTIISVTNEEEHKYLGDHIDASVIGTKALSSSKITMKESGSGINVETNRITWVSEGMYANALITAGIEDADIYVTAPFDVSGTGALTGLIKAYEESTEESIPEEQKQTANEELVKTAELGEEYGMEDAAELMARVKEAIAEENIETEEDLRALIQRVAEELDMNITDEELESLVSLFDRIKGLNIDWDQVKNQLGDISDNISGFVESEEGQSMLQSMINFFHSLLDIVSGWFESDTASTK